MRSGEKHENILMELFEEGRNWFFEKEIDNILAGVNERNLCGRLAMYFEKLLDKHGLSEYYSDPEYNRKQNGEIKTILDNEMRVIKINCDIIVHSRGKNIGRDNLLAIEMKKSNRPELEKLSDKIRLRALTKESYDSVWSIDGKTYPEHVCGYELGIYMELDIERRICLFESYEKGTKILDWNEKF
ncbi:MAG: hypothetical protein Aureis2KO_04450 [Aureisphaera sp.]